MLAAATGVPGALAAPPESPEGHEASTGFALVGRGFVTFTVAWITPRLVDHPYYQQWNTRRDEQDSHRRASAAYTVMLLELANRSSLSVEGYLSVNVRLRVDGERCRPVADASFAADHPTLVPTQLLEHVDPGETFVRVYAFPKVGPEAQEVFFIVRPLWLLRRRTQVSHLPEFELRFQPGHLALPP